MTHYISITYFHPFCPYSHNDLNLSFFQWVIPEVEF
jgi:hypothetical protein